MKNFSVRTTEKGFAAIVSLLAIMGMAVVFSSGFLFVTLRGIEGMQAEIHSAQGYYASEAGIEDAIYRIKNGKNIGAQTILSVGSASATTTMAVNGQTTTIVGEGGLGDAVRKVQVDLDISTYESDFYYGVQVGEGGISMSNGSQIVGSVYSDGDITGSGTITGDAIVAGGLAATSTLSWITADSDHFFATASSNRDIAQSFVATAGGKLNRVSVYLGKVGNPTSNITLRLANDNSGKPSTGSLASATISYTSVGVTPSWIDVSFSSAPTLVNGTKYWIVLDYGSNSATNHWNWRKDSADGYTGNTGKYTSNCCSGNPTWSDAGGDLLFRAWIGGVATKIQGVTIGDASSGTAYANSFVSTTVHGSSCPNAYCVIDSQPQQPMPISDGVIQDWRDAAAAGGVCVSPQCDASGNFNITNGASAVMGPKEITGNLSASNNAHLTISGTVWVHGNVSLSNNCIVDLDPGYAGLSGVLVVDGTIDVSNGCVFSGSGSPGSYIMLLSAKDAPTQDVIEVSNNSAGVIFYASKGRIEFENNASAKEAVGYGIDLANNATITYESGLANLNFSAGPSAGWAISGWREIQ